MEDQYNILEDAVRDMFARAVWSHKIQEKQADVYQQQYKFMETLNIICASLTSVGILSIIFSDKLWVKIVSTVLSFVTVFIGAYFKSFAPHKLEKAHKEAANNLLIVRNEITCLITSINRPGTCSGMATFIRKICAGLSISVIGILLAMVGYDETIASAGMRQAASTQSGIAYIYIFVPVLLCVITIFITAKFPMNKKEFLIIKKEIARRKGEDNSKITPEEIAVCEKVTGFRYDRLWNRDNALKLK